MSNLSIRTNEAEETHPSSTTLSNHHIPSTSTSTTTYQTPNPTNPKNVKSLKLISSTDPTQSTTQTIISGVKKAFDTVISYPISSFINPSSSIITNPKQDEIEMKPNQVDRRPIPPLESDRNPRPLSTSSSTRTSRIPNPTHLPDHPTLTGTGTLFRRPSISSSTASSSSSSSSTWWRFWRNSSSSSSSSSSDSTTSDTRQYSEFTLMTPSSDLSRPKRIPIDFLNHHTTNLLSHDLTSNSTQIPGYDSFTSSTINPALQRLLAFWRDRNECDSTELEGNPKPINLQIDLTSNEVDEEERLSPLIINHPEEANLSHDKIPAHPKTSRCLPKIKRQPLSAMHKLCFKEGGRLSILKDRDDSLKPKTSRSAWWLDITNPNEQDMKQVGKVFGIHPLTIEDILQTDDREKSEMFDKLGYYLISFRGLDESNFQEEVIDDDDDHHQEGMEEISESGGIGAGEEWSVNHASLMTMRSLRSRKIRRSRKRLRVKDGAIGVGAVNMYLIVFGDGIISVHFEDLQKHIDRVKERIQSFSAPSHYISPHWIAHGLMDSIIDSFFPILSYVEKESDELDDYLSDPLQSKQTRLSTMDPTFNRFKMLDRITQNRKLVVMMTRLLNQKVQVVEGLRKRMGGSDQESEIHLHFGDLQDHIMAIFQTLNFYDTLLSNAHLTYLGILRITLDRTKLSQDILIIRLYTLSLIAYPMLSVIGFHSMNINIPKNGDRDDHLRSDGSSSPYYVFGIVLVICCVVGLGMGLLVRGIFRKSEEVYRRKVVDRWILKA
ncbi:uncharacterized protein MELLADRAFT_116070 [Melampsora larici-populina 98AG31]|uniref:Uncharacterized protein n=1 Tax=Melampsora larici-populina (strain 98AG31 / pathotype 3-4-7) TaxID=747676 RepID=F4RGW4_MELLP|nr:uncharacterized protein MELLADRAFT_116070 [Melampsora larici-populina 98AG31]EGG08326.1 hypothetical protein MELLADRAFT_116070 [Melampsora larici-populina 98AG31]